MICPNCFSECSHVIDSRRTKRGRRRRYECYDCGTRFTTQEGYEVDIEKIKADERRQIYAELRHAVDAIFKT